MMHDKIREELAQLLREEQAIWAAGSSTQMIDHARVAEIRERRLQLLRQQASK